jgi:hypothetical protein
MSMDVQLQPPGGDQRERYAVDYVDCTDLLALRVQNRDGGARVSIHTYTARQCDDLIEVLTEMRRTHHRRALAAQRETIKK